MNAFHFSSQRLERVAHALVWVQWKQGFREQSDQIIIRVVDNRLTVSGHVMCMCMVYNGMWWTGLTAVSVHCIIMGFMNGCGFPFSYLETHMRCIPIHPNTDAHSTTKVCSSTVIKLGCVLLSILIGNGEVHLYGVCTSHDCI